MEVFGLYGHRKPAKRLAYNQKKNSYTAVPEHFYYEDIDESSELVQPIKGLFTESTSKTILVESIIPFEENDKIIIDGNEWLLVDTFITKDHQKSGLTAFDFEPSLRKRRILTLS